MDENLRERSQLQKASMRTVVLTIGGADLSLMSIQIGLKRCRQFRAKFGFDLSGLIINKLRMSPSSKPGGVGHGIYQYGLMIKREANVNRLRMSMLVVGH